MKTSFFNTTEKVVQLQQEIRSWIGTPFVPNGTVKGAGASCQTLVGSIYKNVGFLPPDFVIPVGPMAWKHRHSLIQQFVDSIPAFEKLEIITFHLRPGDMIGFDIGGVIHHCGVMYDYDQFIHVFEKTRIKAVLSSIRDATFGCRISAAWRPSIL